MVHSFPTRRSSDRAAAAVGMRPIGERIAFGRRLLGEFLDVIDLEGEMGQVRSDDNWAAFVKFAELDFFIAASTTRSILNRRISP